MGYWSNKATEQAEEYENARSFLCEVGCLEECENHDGVYWDGGEDIETAYRIANARITSGQIVLAKNETRRQFTDLLKTVYDDNSAGDACYICKKNFGPD